MVKCYHTGLPKAFCGHCNGTHPLQVEPFSGRARVDDAPHLFKGRDKAEWRGIGTTVSAERGNVALADKRMSNVTQDTLPKGSCVRASGFSQWGQEQAMRTLAESNIRAKR